MLRYKCNKITKKLEKYVAKVKNNKLLVDVLQTERHL